LIKKRIFDGNPKTVQLNKSGDTYEFRMVMKKGIDQDPDVIDFLKEFNEEISAEVFNFPLLKLTCVTISLGLFA
jgi:hypothetical protein